MVAISEFEGVRSDFLKKASMINLPFSEISQKDPKALKIWETVQEVKEEYRGTELMQPSAIYQFFHASIQGNLLHLYSSSTVSSSSPSSLFPSF